MLDIGCSAVIFDRGSAEPQGSANICQGFRSWPVKNNLASEVTPDEVIENQQIALLRIYFCIDLLCLIIFVVSNFGIFAL